MKANLTKINEWIAINAPLSRETLCCKTQIGFYTLDRILKGRKQPTLAELAILAKVTGTELEDLIDKQDQVIA